MKEITDVNNKKVLVIGLARSGRAAAALLVKHGAIVTVSDSKPADQLGSLVSELEQLGVTVAAGQPQPAALNDADLIVLSPGVPMAQPMIQEAIARQVPVISEIELASRYCKGKIAAVTGTNGKTTTVHLLYQIAEEAGIPCCLAGNMGTAFSEVAETVPENGLAVLEISSFQLEGIKTFRPNAAAILNITPDHMDRYESMQHYVEAKAAVMRNQKPKDVIVLNGEDKYTPLLTNQAQSRVLTFSSKRPPEIEGCWVKDGEIHYRFFGLGQDVLMLADELLIPGPHNLDNALAAAAMALSLSIDPKHIVQTLKKFKSVRHRLESCGKVNHVQYVNDSKATNIDAVAKAVVSYRHPVILILGGKDKQGDFKQLNELINTHARAVVAMGEAKKTIVEQLAVDCPVEEAENLEQAVRQARQLAQASDVVLLSPGCASFDQFENFEERGDAFCRLIEEMKEAKQC